MAGQASALEQGCVCAWYLSKRRLKLLDPGNSLPERLTSHCWRNWCFLAGDGALDLPVWHDCFQFSFPYQQINVGKRLTAFLPAHLCCYCSGSCSGVQHQQTSTPLGTLSSLVALSGIRCCCDACRVLPEGRWGKGELCCKQLCYRRIVICGGCILLFFESSFLSLPVLSLYSELRGYRSRGGDTTTETISSSTHTS